MAAIQRRTSKQLARSGPHAALGTAAERRAYSAQQANLHGLSVPSSKHRGGVGGGSSTSSGGGRSSSRARSKAPEQPLDKALKNMDLTWPTTVRKVNARFSQLSLRKHPDKGGTNQQMRQLLTDRSTILNALASSGA